MYLPENRIGLLDFGMVGQLSEQRRHEVAELLYGLVSRDADTVVSLLVDWSEDGQASESRLGEDVSDFIDQYHGVPLEQLDLSEKIGRASCRERGAAER